MQVLKCKPNLYLYYIYSLLMGIIYFVAFSLSRCNVYRVANNVIWTIY